jgi:hypothetical protein
MTISLNAVIRRRISDRWCGVSVGSMIERPLLHTGPHLTIDFFRSLEDRDLPTAAEASDSLLLWFAKLRTEIWENSIQ